MRQHAAVIQDGAGTLLAALGPAWCVAPRHGWCVLGEGRDEGQGRDREGFEVKDTRITAVEESEKEEGHAC